MGLNRRKGERLLTRSILLRSCVALVGQGLAPQVVSRYYENGLETVPDITPASV